MEMTGKTLSQIVADDELNHDNLEAAGVDDDTIVRINEHGDIEVRRPARWDAIGGLLGDYVDRVKVKTGLDWV
jgi:hypothetical protein